MSLSQQIRALERIAETGEQHAELVRLKEAYALWHAGYKRGLKEGRDASNVYEQDFAYQPEEYTAGYWAGFKDGINEGKG
jgi:hypothetical protein